MIPEDKAEKKLKEAIRTRMIHFSLRTPSAKTHTKDCKY